VPPFSLMVLSLSSSRTAAEPPLLCGQTGRIASNHNPNYDYEN
jgi:hypothetical protein